MADVFERTWMFMELPLPDSGGCDNEIVSDYFCVSKNDHLHAQNMIAI
jgi:hypothetical protein